MKKFIQSVVEGIYDGIQKSEDLKDQIPREEIEDFVLSAYRSFVNKTSVLLGAIFIYVFFRLRAVDLGNAFIIFITFWMVWVVQDNHLSKLQKMLEEHKKEK